METTHRTAHDRPAATVATIQHGRLDHLRNVAAATARAAHHHGARWELVVVTMGGPDPARVLPTPGDALDVRVVHAPGTLPHLPLSRARNVAVATARAPVVLMLDVDVVPSIDAVPAALSAVAAAPDAVVLGDVRHLPPDVPGDAPEATLRSAGRRHPAQPAPPPHGIAVEDDHDLFWSTAYAGTPATLLGRIGGFDEAYVGYGAEDTDYAWRAARAGVPLVRAPGVVGFHQWHPSQSPPRQHLASIVRNAHRFRARWGRWPMEGWLAAFAAEGLVDWDPEGTRLELLDVQVAA